MQYRRFGATDLTVSSIGFGCARLGGIFQSISKRDMIGTLQRAFDEGITVFDTADMYCQGESEELLGIATRGRRESVFIATKAGYRLPARRKAISRIKPLLRPLIRRAGKVRAHLPTGVRGALSQDFSPGYLHKAVDGSLKRLRTDYIDLFQLHSPPTSLLESGDALVSLEVLKRQGKIRHYGVSCETTQDALIALRYAGLSSLQIRLSLLDVSALDEVVPRAREKGIAIIARECYAGGLLTRHRDALNLESVIADLPEREVKRQQILALNRIAETCGRSLPELALQFVLGIEGVSITLLGMRTSVHLADNLWHLDVPPLGLDVMQALRNGSRVGATEA